MESRKEESQVDDDDGAHAASVAASGDDDGSAATGCTSETYSDIINALTTDAVATGYLGSAWGEWMGPALQPDGEGGPAPFDDDDGDQ
jgi:hypothetical protein